MEASAWNTALGIGEGLGGTFAAKTSLGTFLLLPLAQAWLREVIGQHMVPSTQP